MGPGFVALKEIRLEQEEGKSSRQSKYDFYRRFRGPVYGVARSEPVERLTAQQHRQSARHYLRPHDLDLGLRVRRTRSETLHGGLWQSAEHQKCSSVSFPTTAWVGILSLEENSSPRSEVRKSAEFSRFVDIVRSRPQNLLINERGELKLADFGLARIKSFPTKTYSNEVVTLWYRPPDVLLGSTEYSTPIDIWAVGCIFYEMACGRALFPGNKVEEELHLIFKLLGTPSEKTLPDVTSRAEFQALRLPFYPGEPLQRFVQRLDADGIDLLDKFLRYNPLSRTSAQEAMKHRYFSAYPPEIHQLEPSKSLFDLPGISLTKDHGSKFIASSLMKTALSKRSSVHL